MYLSSDGHTKLFPPFVYYKQCCYKYPGTSCCVDICFLLKFLKHYLYFREREKESIGRGEGQREMERESEADSLLSVEPDARLSPTTLRLWPEPKSRFRHLRDWITQIPKFFIWGFSFFLMHAFIAIKFPLITVFATSQKFW